MRGCVMKTLFRKFAFLTVLFAVSVSIPVRYLPAEEVDFSCMSHQVKGKPQISTQDVCAAKIRNSSQAPMDQFAQKEKELKNKIAAVDRERCQVHAGG